MRPRIRPPLHRGGAGIQGNETRILLLFAAPGILYLLLFSYAPMAGLYMVFTDYTYQGGIFGSAFVGLKNFDFFFYSLGNALRATTNTLVQNLCFILFGGIIIPVCLAVLLNEIRGKTFRKVAQSVIFFPYFLSWAVIGTMTTLFLDEKSGTFNLLLRGMGLPGVRWNSEPNVWIPILTVCNAFKMSGYNSLIYFAVLTGFDASYYESAMMDGAGRATVIRRITVPLLVPTIVIIFLLSVGRIMYGDLSMILGLTNLNPLLLSRTENIDTYVYRTAIRGGDFGYTSAIALYQSLFGFVVLMAANALVKRIDPNYGLF